MKNIFTFLFLMMCCSLLTFQSCKDPVKGCTNENAENYDSAAEEDDNSCIFARDKFLSAYYGSIDCGLPLNFVDSFRMEISEGLSGDNEVEIEFKDLETPLPILKGHAKGDSLIIPADTFELAILEQTPDVKYPVVIDGYAIMMDNENSLTGILNLEAIVAIGNLNSSCDIDASKE